MGRANSLFGTTAGDEIGFRLVALTNGNYVVNSDTWDDGTTANVGSVTWGDGSTGTIGAVTAANSLVGSNRNDLFDSVAVPLANGNYVVASPSWTFGSNSKAGAATWRPGTGPAPGLVSRGNSLAGTNSDDGEFLLVTALPNGDYVIDLPGWDRGATLDAGAVTFGSGTSSASGPISVTSSIVGRSAGDKIGLRISVFPDGRYASYSERWDALPETDSGVVIVAPSTGLSGEVDAGNSLQGHFVNGGSGLNVADRYTSAGSIVVGRPAENRVTIVTPSPAPPSGTGASGFAALSPVRVFDTRPSEPQGLVAVVKQRYGGANALKVKVTGIAGVPVAGVGAVSLNVTVVESDAPGFVTVFPCGDRPLASSLNYVAGQIVPNAVIAPVSPQGEICFFSSADTHLIADINGWFASGPGFAALSPVRVFDTRPPEPQGVVAVVKQKYGGGNVLKVKVAGSAGVPVADVGAVSLNVTAVEPDAPGFVTVFPCGDRPLASSVNYVAGQIVPNAVIAPLSEDGEVCLFSSADTHLIADVNGWFAG